MAASSAAQILSDKSLARFYIRELFACNAHSYDWKITLGRLVADIPVLLGDSPG